MSTPRLTLAAAAGLAAAAALALALARDAGGARGGPGASVRPAHAAPGAAERAEPPARAEEARAALARDPAAAPSTAPAAPPAAPARAYAARGVAVDVDGRAVAGVALACAADGPAPAARGVTAADGAFELALPRAITAIVSADPAWVVLSGGAWRAADVDPLRLVLAPAGRVTGWVVDAATEQPLRATVAIVPPPFEDVPPLWSELVTAEADGAFALERAPAAKGTRVEASAGGYAPAAVELAPGQSDAGVLRLEPIAPARVSGTVLLPGGAPAAGARVALGSAATAADQDGAFALSTTVVEPGAALIATHAPHGAFVIERFADRVLAGEPTEDVVLALAAGAAIEGRVVDREGRPQKRWRVEARLGGPEGPIAARADGTRTDGVFRIEGLLPGAYALCGLGRGAEVAIALDVAAPSSGVQLVVGAAERSIAGRVLDADGRPAAGARVRVAHPFGAAALAQTVADAHGRFTLERVPALPARLIARLEGGLLAEHRLDPIAPAAEVVLRLERGRALRFEARDAARPPDRLFAVDAGGAVVALGTPGGEELRSVALHGGRSPALLAPERARALVLVRAGRELARVPLAPGDLGVVRW